MVKNAKNLLVVERAGKLVAGKKDGKNCSRWKERQKLKKEENAGKRLVG